MSNVATPARRCAKCGIEKPRTTEHFLQTLGGYWRSYCKPCHNRNGHERKRAKEKGCKESLEKHNARMRAKRRDPDLVPRHVYSDSRKSDQKRGFPNDLTFDFVCEVLAKGCSYCGETQLRMTLDRIDNATGHTQSNVNPSCIRCNYARGAMPYQAWLCLVPGMREAREKGLFLAWTGRARMVQPL